MSAEEWHFFQFREILLYWVKNFLITERFYASVLLSLAHTHLHLCLWLYCMWMCRQPSLSSIIHLWRLFNSRRSPVCLFPPRVDSLFSSTFSLMLFSPVLLFSASFHPHVCLPFMPQTFHPLLHPPPTHHQPSPATIPPSLHLLQSWGIPSLLMAWQEMGVSLLLFLASSFYPPNSAPPLLFPPNNLLSCQGDL